MVAAQPMTDDQRKHLVAEYLRRLDYGEDVIDLFDEKAEVYFPKWGTAYGTEQIKKLFADLYLLFNDLKHPITYANIIQQGDFLVLESTTHGELKDGTKWRGGESGYAGRYCDVIEVRDFKIQRLYIYTDPDYADADRDRYPWHKRG